MSASPFVMFVRLRAYQEKYPECDAKGYETVQRRWDVSGPCSLGADAHHRVQSKRHPSCVVIFCSLCRTPLERPKATFGSSWT